MADEKIIIRSVTSPVFGIAGEVPAGVFTPGDPAAAEAGRRWFREPRVPGAQPPFGRVRQAEPIPMPEPQVHN